MNKHALLSPSKADRWVNCPASAKAEYNMPEMYSEAAAEGTKAHEYVANVLLGKQTEYVPDCESYIEYILSLKEGASYFDIEKKVFINDDFYGTADAIIVNENITHIVDFKYGFAHVSPEENKQLLSYAIGAPESDFYRLTIVQPRAFKQGGPIFSWTISKEELHAYKEEILNAANVALSDKAFFKAGSHCKYCKFKKHCKEFMTFANDSSEQVEEGKELRNLLEKKKAIEARIEILKASIIDKLSTGCIINGFELKEGRSTRRWAFSDTEIVTLTEEFGIDLTTVVSPYEAEKRGLPREIIDKFTESVKGKYGLDIL